MKGTPQTSLSISIPPSSLVPDSSSEEFVETRQCRRILLVYNLLPLIKTSPFKVQSIFLQRRSKRVRRPDMRDIKAKILSHDGIVWMNWWQIQVSEQCYDVILMWYDTVWKIWTEQWITTLKRCYITLSDKHLSIYLWKNNVIKNYIDSSKLWHFLHWHDLENVVQ